MSSRITVANTVISNFTRTRSPITSDTALNGTNTPADPVRGHVRVELCGDPSTTCPTAMKRCGGVCKIDPRYGDADQRLRPSVPAGHHVAVLGAVPGRAGGQRTDSAARHLGWRQNNASWTKVSAMPEVRLSVGSMQCRHCLREVTGWLRDVIGVETVTADARTGTVVLGGTMTVADVLAVFAGSGYIPQVVDAAPGTTT